MARIQGNKNGISIDLMTLDIRQDIEAYPKQPEMTPSSTATTLFFHPQYTPSSDLSQVPF